MTKGGRNLVILGILSCAIAVGTAGVSLAVYHGTGDIYLDRSRPGFLPDKEEIAEEEEDHGDGDYKFVPNGTVTGEVLDEYLKELKEEIDTLNLYENPFDASALSDERLGIEE